MHPIRTDYCASMRALSDDELRDRLKANGYEPGPITPATRQVYERKLERLLKDNKAASRTPRSDQCLQSESVKIQGTCASVVIS